VSWLRVRQTGQPDLTEVMIGNRFWPVSATRARGIVAGRAKGKMTSSGNITFDGCRAGSEKTSPENPTGNNLPKATSSVVPDITTKGSRTPTFGRTPSTNNTPIPGTTNTYRNGQKI
jgi:hypothetical protein